MRPHPKLWRESASIIALAKNGLNKVHSSKISDYKILLQQRSSKSEFLPSTIVFPGGTVEECDGGTEWFNHFKSFGLRKDDFRYFYSKSTLVPPILQGVEDPVVR